MNKLLLGGLCVATAAIAVAPKVISSNIAEQTAAMVSKLNEVPLYSAELVEYDAGWLSSDAVIKVTIAMGKILPPTAPDKPPMEDFEMLFELNVDHGPVISSGGHLANLEILYKAENLKQSLKWNQANPLLQVSAQIALDGAISYQDSSEPFTYTTDNNITIDVAAYNGEAKTVGNSVVHYGTLPLVKVMSQEMQLDFNQLTIDTSIDSDLASMFSYDSVPQYNTTISMNDLTFQSEDSQDVGTFEHLSIYVDSVVDQTTGLVSLEQIIKLGRFDFGEQYGQEFEVAIEVNNVEEQTYIALNKLFAQPDAALTPEQQMATIGEFFQRNLLATLKPEPEVNITRLVGTLPEGKFNAVLNAKIENVTQAPELISDPAFWLTHLNADSNMQVARPLFELIAEKMLYSQLVNNPQLAGSTPEEIAQIAQQQTPQYVNMLVTQGMIVLNEATDEYTLEFEIAEGVAILNGNNVPLPL